VSFCILVDFEQTCGIGESMRVDVLGCDLGAGSPSGHRPSARLSKDRPNDRLLSDRLSRDSPHEFDLRTSDRHVKLCSAAIFTSQNQPHVWGRHKFCVQGRRLTRSQWPRSRHQSRRA